MNIVSQEEFSQAIEFMREKYLKEYNLDSISEINNGLCVEFGEEVLSFLKLEEGRNCNLWDIDNFRDFWTEEWHIEAVQIELNSQPVKNMTWEQLNLIPFGHHRWITYQGKHYDAECSKGVSNVFELPFFNQYIENYLKSEQECVLWIKKN